MPTLVLPSMVAGRDLADALVERLAGDLTGTEVVVDCRRLVSASPSFAAQLVLRVLVDRRAGSLEVEHAPAAFGTYLQQAARRIGVADRLHVSAREPAPA
jgi:hypothetical protein